MPLDTEAGLSPGDIVFDGDPVPPWKEAHHHPLPFFSPCVLWPNGWMDALQNTTWYAGSPLPRHQCVRLGPSFPHGKG